jgi:hypothetical protein
MAAALTCTNGTSTTWSITLPRRAGRFGIERLMFHLVGVPTYIVVAELAGHVLLHGDLPCPGYPDALATRGQWVTYDKQLIDRAGLRGADAVLAGLRAEPAVLPRSDCRP